MGWPPATPPRKPEDFVWSVLTLAIPIMLSMSATMSTLRAASSSMVESNLVLDVSDVTAVTKLAVTRVTCVTPATRRGREFRDCVESSLFLPPCRE